MIVEKKKDKKRQLQGLCPAARVDEEGENLLENTVDPLPYFASQACMRPAFTNIYLNTVFDRRGNMSDQSRVNSSPSCSSDTDIQLRLPALTFGKLNGLCFNLSGGAAEVFEK